MPMPKVTHLPGEPTLAAPPPPPPDLSNAPMPSSITTSHAPGLPHDYRPSLPVQAPPTLPTTATAPEPPIPASSITAIVARISTDKALNMLTSDLREVVASAKDILKIENTAESANGQRLFMALMAAREALESRLKYFTEPINKVLKGISALPADDIDAATDEQKRLKRLILDHRKADRQMRHDTVSHLLPQVPGVSTTPTVPTTADRAIERAFGLPSRFPWTFIIDNPELVPREYCSPDPKKLHAAVDTLGVRSIPGCTIAQEEQLVRAPRRRA